MSSCTETKLDVLYNSENTLNEINEENPDEEDPDEEDSDEEDPDEEDPDKEDPDEEDPDEEDPDKEDPDEEDPDEEDPDKEDPDEEDPDEEDPDEEDPDENESNSITGEWKGELISSSDCYSIGEYDFELKITSYNSSNKTIQATLEISNKWLANDFVKYNCTGSYISKILTINTINIYEKSQRMCEICSENSYVLKYYKKHLTGKWTTANCSGSTFSDKNTLKLKK